MRQTLLLRNVTKSKKLRGAQCSSELALRSTDFRSPENLILPALYLFHIHFNLVTVIIAGFLISTAFSGAVLIRGRHLLKGGVYSNIDANDVALARRRRLI